MQVMNGIRLSLWHFHRIHQVARWFLHFLRKILEDVIKKIRPFLVRFYIISTQGSLRRLAFFSKQVAYLCLAVRTP